jgi:DNA repair exonuclease SbcCD ATPase subunit
MKVQTILPWICVLGLSAGAAALYVSGQKKETELTQLRQENQDAQGLRTQLEEVNGRIKAQEEELTGLRKDKEDLLRLRNEVRQLQQAKQQLTQQAAAAQADAEQAKARAAQAAQAAQAGAQQLQAERQQTAAAQIEASRKTQRDILVCVTNLRQLDGAKQQWALEHGKTADAMPTAQDIVPYLKDNTLPACPAGGTYTLNAVNQAPTCSVPVHVLPR